MALLLVTGQSGSLCTQDGLRRGPQAGMASGTLPADSVLPPQPRPAQALAERLLGDEAKALLKLVISGERREGGRGGTHSLSPCWHSPLPPSMTKLILLPLLMGHGGKD